MKEKSRVKVITYDKDGVSIDSDVCTGDLVPIKGLLTPYEDDLCKVCEEDLFFTSEVTKRIAILNGKGDEVTGWVCPACYTEFDQTDNILVLMSRTSVQGKA